MTKQISPLAGQPAQTAQLVDVSQLVHDYSARRPDPAVPGQRVAFGRHADLPIRRNDEAADPGLDVLRPEDLGDASCESAPRSRRESDDEDANRRTLRKLTKIREIEIRVTRNRPAA